MKAACLFLLVTTLVASAQTNDWARELQNSKRIVSGRTIDITPLVNWQSKQLQSPRPLTAWVQITGRITATNIHGWAVLGSVDGQPQLKPVIIRNPPKELTDEYNRMKAQFTVLERTQARASADLETAQQRYEQTDAEFKRAQLIRFSGDALEMALDNVNAARAAATRASVAAEAFDWRGQNPKGDFILQCYAVKTGTAYQGLLIYDHGVVTK
ncbi:MAG: hypothetical protein HY301_11715 [Verrucomicrobia bacterium]|nr:hypothetical protein [Verrucomicrobiota bacterium]